MRSQVLSILALAGYATAAACPFHELARSGALSDSDLAKYEAVKRDPKAAEALFAAHQSETANVKPQKRQLLSGLGALLSNVTNDLGGGLLNGVLQPLTGILADLDLPTPQAQGLVQIPGDDPDHQFQYPGPTDQRGLCPTLNTLANHGYISRDGITTFAEAANAVQTGYGFGYGVSVMLSAIGLMAGGDLISGKYSIGGADSRVPNTLGPSLGLDKHGVFEIDGSITREDIYFGNPADFRASRWERLVNITNSYGGQFGEETFIEEKGVAYDESRATNPDAFFGAKWFIVAHAERAFVYRGLPNGTDIGNADYANIAPFFLNETFPENWYRRGEAYDIVNVVTDILDLYLGSPRELGANEGLDDFVPLGVDISSLSVDQVACFVVENVLDIVPDSVQPTLVENLDTFAAFVNAVIVPFFADYDCPLESFVGPSANATGDEIGSLANDGPVIIDGVYES